MPDLTISDLEDARPRPRFLLILLGAVLATSLLFGCCAWALGDRFYLRLATEALLCSWLALSVELLLGQAGLLSLGQALYFGLGAYVSALMLKHVATSFALAVSATLVAATAVSALAGVIALRARGVYFTILSFSLAQILAKAAYNTPSLGASDGLGGIPLLDIHLGIRIPTGAPFPFFLFTLAMTIALYSAVLYLLETPFGRVLAAIRANEGRVPFLGYSAHRHLLVIYILAADIAALGGALYPMLRGFVSPELMSFRASGDAVINVILGGSGTLMGPLLGTLALTLLRSLISTFSEHHPIWIGLLFVGCVLLLPQGLVGWLQARLVRRGRSP